MSRYVFSPNWQLINNFVFLLIRNPKYQLKSLYVARTFLQEDSGKDVSLTTFLGYVFKLFFLKEVFSEEEITSKAKSNGISFYSVKELLSKEDS